MGCCQYFAPTDGGADTFTVEMPRVTFGRGCLAELGERASGRNLRRVAVLTDPTLNGGEQLAKALESLIAAGIDHAVFSEVFIEPNDASVMQAAEFLSDGGFDGVISLGGGSVMDTAKAAMVYALYPASFNSYFPAPVGGGVTVPGPVLPHIACPTTSGTGSETTCLSVIRLLDLNTKFVLGHRFLLPTEALIDPANIDTLPTRVVASSGFDLLCHAIECYTARAYTRWAKVPDPNARPMVQGANPWSDLHAREALRIVGQYLVRGVADNGDHEARDKLMWAASLAGMAFGNCGTHLPHALSYAITQMVQGISTEDYPIPAPFVPHGISVVVNAPSVFRFTASVAPERHLEAAECLAAETGGAIPEDAGEIVATRIIDLMQQTGMPNGIGALGFETGHTDTLAESAIRQRRAIGNAPRDTNQQDIAGIFERAVGYW